MTKAFLLHELFQDPSPYLINTVLELYEKELLGLGHHILKKNFYYLPLEKEDLSNLILKSIKTLKSVSEGSWAKFSFFSILKKVFVQQLITLQRHYQTHKHNVLTICQEEVDFFAELSKTEFDHNYLFNIEMQQVFSHIKNQLNPLQQKVFILYLLGNTPQQIQNHVHIPVKRIYNILFKIKKLCSNKQIRELI